ncbi:hypothetical protein CHS0354_007932 [Potamilus streckersoni]|uniref:Uncharacterized protein n=1 Tax=Potamilus streckersoni TaxID=2493646 RepID=A0AAE0S8S3_9BIVA|nr:hypothetical protein CHS0354_007932 [Potamilus streckersoni]
MKYVFVRYFRVKDICVTITDANQMRCSCFYEHMNAHITPVHTLSTTMSLTTSENKPMSERTTPHSTNSTSAATSPTATFTGTYYFKTTLQFLNILMLKLSENILLNEGSETLVVNIDSFVQGWVGQHSSFKR